MINAKLYDAVGRAYEDFDEELNHQLEICNTPQETVDNAALYHEAAKRRLEIAEWETFYSYGGAVHLEVMAHPGDTYLAAGNRLGLNRFYTVISIRTYQLFRDHIYNLSKFRGLTPAELYRVSMRSFERTLTHLNEAYPVAAIPDLDLDFV
jgi:hypothetical protein